MMYIKKLNFSFITNWYITSGKFYATGLTKRMANVGCIVPVFKYCYLKNVTCETLSYILKNLSKLISFCPYFLA